MSRNKYFLDIEETVYNGKLINRIGIQIKNLLLFESVSVAISIYYDKKIADDGIILEISGEDYQNWHDDSYLVSIILKIFGFTKRIYELPDDN